jgi:hypothetical protein
MLVGPDGGQQACRPEVALAATWVLSLWMSCARPMESRDLFWIESACRRACCRCDHTCPPPAPSPDMMLPKKNAMLRYAFYLCLLVK